MRRQSKIITLIASLLFGFSGASIASEKASCTGLLSPDFFQPLIKHGVFISQFSPGVSRQKGSALCAPVAAANAAQALYYSMRGCAVSPEYLIEFVNEAWASFQQVLELDPNQGVPEMFLPALALGAADKVKILSKVAPVLKFDPIALAKSPEEIISTRSRIRMLGIETPNGAHVLLSLGYDQNSNELLILDPNDATQIMRFKIQIKDQKIYIERSHSPIDGAVALHPSPANSGKSHLVLGVFGLNIKEDEAANEPVGPSEN